MSTSSITLNPLTATPQVSQVGTTGTQATPTTALYQYGDLGIPFVAPVAGLTSPQAPGDSEALVAFILGKLQKSLATARSDEDAAGIQAAFQRIAALQAQAKQAYDAAQSIVGAQVQIVNETREKPQNVQQLSELYQTLTGSASQRDLTQVTADASGGQGVYGQYLAAMASYNNANSDYGTKKTAYDTANGAQAADQKTANDQYNNNVKPAIEGLKQVLSQLNQSNIQNNIGSINSILGSDSNGQIMKDVNDYINRVGALTTGASIPPFTQIYGDYASLSSAENNADQTTLANLIGSSQNGSLSKQLNTYLTEERTISTNISTGTYTSNISNASTALGQATSALAAAEAALAPFLDKTGVSTSNGQTTVSFSDPNANGGTGSASYAFQISDSSAYASTGRVSALRGAISKLQTRDDTIDQDLGTGTPTSLPDAILAAQTLLKASAAALVAAVAAAMSSLKTSGHAHTDFQENEALDNTLKQQQQAITRSEAALTASIDRASRITADSRDAAKIDLALPLGSVLDATTALVATLAELSALAADPAQQTSTAAQTGANGRTYVGLPSFS